MSPLGRKLLSLVWVHPDGSLESPCTIPGWSDYLYFCRICAMSEVRS